MGKKVVPGEKNMPESVKKMIDERIYHCPNCGIENILYDFEELPPDSRKHFEELAIEILERDKNAAMCPIVGWCPVCKKYSTCSIGFEHKKKYKSYVKNRRRYS
ncbi:hypothetical protein ES705_27284 [subsurface metagenome]